MSDAPATAVYAPQILAGAEFAFGADDMFERIVENFSRYVGIAGLVTAVAGLAFLIF